MAQTLFPTAIVAKAGLGGLVTDIDDDPASPDGNWCAVAGTGEWQLAAGHYETAKIALEIIAPRSGLSTANVYYRAYPGIQYKLPVAVLGGAWPFKYELTTAPSGMTIGEVYGDANYGIIVWDNPTSGDHSVAIRVTDQESTQATVSWTLTVTTSNYLFLDSVNGSDSNAGTLASPKQTINGWYNSAKTNDAYAGYFVYYRTGTYNTDDAPIEDGIRMACTGNDKPKVHMAYPGETATLDLSNAHWACYSDSTGDYCWAGLSITGVSTSNAYKGFTIDSGPDDLLFYANTIAQPTTQGAGSSNASILMIANGGGTTDYIAVIGNTYLGTWDHDLLLGYNTRKGVVEGNNIEANDSWGFYFKSNSQYWTVRNNAGLTDNSGELVRLDSYGTAADIDICWNNFKTTSYAVMIGYEANATGALHDYRNTWQTTYNTSINATTGTWDATRNVVIHNGSYTNGYRRESGSVTITLTGTELHNSSASGIINTTTGALIDSSRTTYLGTRGHEVA